MRHTLVGVGQSPDSPSPLPQPVTKRNEPILRFHHLRLYFYILRGVLLLALTIVVFNSGATMIRQNSRVLGVFALNLDVPLPFLLIGLWGIALLALSIFFLTTLRKISRLLAQYLHRPGAGQP